MKKIKLNRQITDGSESKCSTFRISQFVEMARNINELQTVRLPFADRRNRNRILELPIKDTLKMSAKRILPQSTHNLRDKTTAAINICRLVRLQSSEFADKIVSEIEHCKRKGIEIMKREASQVLGEIFYISESIYEEIYSYKIVQSHIKKLHELVKEVGSKTFLYKSFAYSGFTLFQYGSYSLSLYYFDRALKSFYDRDTSFYQDYERRFELQLYKHISKIFLVKDRYIEARNFAFKLLRKSWVIGDIDEQLTVYDLLGKIYMEMQNISMSRYFHYRMKSGQQQNNEIIAMSKHLMEKEQNEKITFVCYETINIFVDKDAKFNDILENHYQMRSLEYSKEIGIKENQTRQIYIYTHHSPNRLLNNYHLLQRKMIEARESKQIHFVKPKDCHRLRKISSEYSSTVSEIKKKYDSISVSEDLKYHQELQ